MFILFPYALRYSFLSLCRLHLQSFFQYVNTCIRIPVMNRVTFWAPQIRMHRFFTSGFRQPQKLQVWLLGYIVGTLRISFPYQIALYSSISKNFAQETLAMDFASLWFRIIPFTFKSSMQMVWFRAPAALTVSAGNHSFDWLLLMYSGYFDPLLLPVFRFRESLRCSLMSFRIERSRYLGFDTVFPLLSE